MHLSRLAKASLIAALLAGIAHPVVAAPSAEGRPNRGLRMDVVEARFGAPTTRYPAVGKPPITRWDYPSMVVYFENDRVIHAVTAAAAAATASPSAPDSQP